MSMCDVNLIFLENYVICFSICLKKQTFKIAVSVGESFPNYAFQDKVEIVLFSGNQVVAKLVSAYRIIICCDLC